MHPRYVSALVVLLPLTLCAQTEVEPNNTPATANALTLGAPMNGDWCNGEVPDLFSFTTTADGYLDVAFDALHASSQINVFVDVRLLDGNGTDVDGYVATSGPNGMVQTNPHQLYCLAAGTYYLSVQGAANGECNSYELTADLVQPVFGNDTEDNDNSSQAQSVLADTWTEGHANYSYGDDNADWFRLVIPGDGVVRFDLDAYNQTNGTYSGTLELLDAAQDSLNAYTFIIGGLFQPDTSFNTYTRFCLGQGTYYLRLSSDGMCGLSYRLKWNFTPPAFTDDVEDNDDAQQATPLTDGVWAQGHENYDTYDDNVDWYRFSMPADGVVNLYIDAFNQNGGTYPGTLELLDGAQDSLNTYTFTIGAIFQPDTAFNSYTRFCLGQGTYYLRVSSGMCGLSYRVRYSSTLAPLQDDAEDNDTQATSLPVSNGVQREGHLNFDVDNSDWYSFNVADGATPSAVFAASHQNGGTYYLPVAWFDGSGTELGSYDYIVNGGSSFVDATIPLGTLAQGTCYMHLASNACGTSYRFTMNGVSAMGLVQLPANRAPIRVVPNPSTDGIFTLSAPFRAVRVQLMDVEGRKLMDEPVSTMFGSITLDTSRFPPGTYTAHLMGADGSTGHVRLMRIH